MADKLRKLAILKFRWELDGLDWHLVRSMIQAILMNTLIEVLFCILDLRDIRMTSRPAYIKKPWEFSCSGTYPVDALFHEMSGSNLGYLGKMYNSVCAITVTYIIHYIS